MELVNAREQAAAQREELIRARAREGGGELGQAKAGRGLGDGGCMRGGPGGKGGSGQDDGGHMRGALIVWVGWGVGWGCCGTLGRSTSQLGGERLAATTLVCLLCG